MSKTYKGQITNSVVELTLQEEAVGGGFDTPTIVWDDTVNGEIDQVQGDIPDNWKNFGGIKQLQIGSSCTSIGSNAFYNCSQMNCANLVPNSVTTIGDNAFYNGSGLTGTLNISENITSIGSNAFYFCNNITRVEIHATTAPTIGSFAFYGMSGVSPAEIHVPAGATGYAASYDGLTVVADL